MKRTNTQNSSNSAAGRVVALALTALAASATPALAADTVKNPAWPTTPALNTERAELERIFASPAEVTTGLYWYWISGNISPEGVEKDVRSMKKAGINRAYIGFQGLEGHEAPRGPVYIQTPEWYECVRTAMRTATEEGIEIGVFNCPGWSQSGGPWISPEQSQRYLTTAQTTVEGGRGPQTIALPHPANLLQDVKVLAYPAKALRNISSATDRIECENVTEVDAMFDGNLESAARFSADKASVTVYTDAPFTLRSVVLRTANPVRGNVAVSALKDGEWVPVGSFDANRTNMMIEVGYDRLAPTAAALPETTAEAFRFDFAINQNCVLNELTVSEAPVVNVYADQIMSKMFQTPHPFWEQYKWPASPQYSPEAVVAEADIIDLTDRLAGDNLTWEAPEGQWIVTRAFMAPTDVPNSPALDGDGKGLEIDRWNPDVLRHHYDSFIGDIMAHVPAEERATWKYIVSDSYERATQNFGDDFIEYFTQHMGYDPTPYLLTYNGTVVGSADLSERFLWDMRRVVADRLAYDHIGGLRKMANADGMKLWLEPYGHWGFPGEFLMYGGQSDEVAGEFWSEGSLGDIENRAASSVAHTYGKGRTFAESFTVGGREFTRSPRTMKGRGDKFFTEGINATLLHLMISQFDDDVMPGVNCPFGNEFNRKNTWFSQLDQFTDYLKRCNLLLQQGNYVADVAYFIGESAPVMIGITEPELPYGHQYDFINAEVIENTLTASADHTLSLPHGTTYRLLVLPPLTTMRPQLLSAIKQLIEDGAVVLGPKPLRSPSLQNYPEADAQVRALADEMWGPGEVAAPGIRKIGKGLLISGMDMKQVFNLLDITPDFAHTAGKSADIRYAHTATPDGRHIYYIANQDNEPREITAVFRSGAGLQPELWDAQQGTHRPLPAFSTVNGRVSIPLRLAPMEGTFVVFDRPADADHTESACLLANYPPTTELLEISTPWKVELKPMVGKGKTITLDRLADLTQSDDDYVRHFSGTMVYTTTFRLPDLPADKQIVLDLGDAREMARVKINGREAGGVWTAPYTLNVTDLLRKGKNTIEVEVVNNWANRLIGDSRYSQEERETWYFYHQLNPSFELQPAGLLTPLRLLTY